MPTGDSVHYVSSGGTITPRLADDVLYRKAHDPRPPKPSGLDWDAHTPTCPSCATKSGQIDGTGLCPTCRGTVATPEQTNITTTGRGTYQELDDHDVAHRFTAPDTTPAHDPAPAPAVRPTVRAKVTRTGTHDVLITLRSTTDPIDQVAVAARPSDTRPGIKQQLQELGITARDLKTWAAEHGHITANEISKRGLPSQRLINAYTAAHPTTNTTPTPPAQGAA